MADVFDNKIVCSECNTRMQKKNISKNGFVLRAVVCPECNKKIIHPSDEAEYHKFKNLRSKEFKVKMRLVGNSYAVSIPKEIVHFMNEQKRMKRMMDEMVRLNFEDIGRLSLNFAELGGNSDVPNARIIKAKEVRIVKNNRPVFHARHFSDSAHPERNKTIIKKRKDFEENEELKEMEDDR